LVLTFGATATAFLKKQAEGDEWKYQLDTQVGQFLRLVRDCLRSKEVKNVPTELLNRLDAHCAKLAETTAVPSAPSTSKATLESTPMTIPGMTTNVHEMPLVRAVGKLFGKTTSDLTRDVIAIRRLCSEKVRQLLL
jgi:hypothetical protein